MGGEDIATQPIGRVKRITLAVGGWIEEHPGQAILLAVALGFFAVVLTGLTYKIWCMPIGGNWLWLWHDVREGTCKMVATNPPWLLVSAIAAVPSAVLTWYLRTTQKQADLRIAGGVLVRRDQELRQQRQEFEDARERTNQQVALTRKAQVNDRIARALAMLGEEKIEPRVMGLALLRALVADSPEEQNVIRSLLGSFIRSRWPTRHDDDPPQVDAPDDQEAAVELLGDATLWKESTMPARLDACNLAGVSFLGLKFVDADLSGSDLRGTIVGDVDFSRADFTTASLETIGARGVKFCGAAFYGASLVNAKFEEDCDFNDAMFGGADLCGADLRPANLDGARLEGAQYDKETKFPPGFDAAERGLILDESPAEPRLGK